MKCAVNTSYCLIEVVTKAGLTTYLVLIVFVGYKSVWTIFFLSIALLPQCCVLSGEAKNTNFIVFGLIRSGLESTNYHTQGEYANNNTTDEVLYVLEPHHHHLIDK
jgi:hypothetical protein